MTYPDRWGGQAVIPGANLRAALAVPASVGHTGGAGSAARPRWPFKGDQPEP